MVTITKRSENSISENIDLSLPPNLTTAKIKTGTRGRVKRVLRLTPLLLGIKYPVKMAAR